MSVITYLLFVLIIPSALTQERGESMPTAAFERYRHGIVNVGFVKKGGDVKDATWDGTGFLVDDHCTFVTAKHLFANLPKGDIVVVRFLLPSDPSKARTIVARILYQGSDTDISFLKIDVVNNLPCNSGELHVFPLRPHSDENSITGEPVWIIGHPTLARETLAIPVIRSGLISSTEIKFGTEPMLLLDLLGVPGFSGSPVILQRTGEVVGIVYGPGPTRRAFGFEWATPISRTDYENAIATDRQSAE